MARPRVCCAMICAGNKRQRTRHLSWDRRVALGSLGPQATSVVVRNEGRIAPGRVQLGDPRKRTVIAWRSTTHQEIWYLGTMLRRALLLPLLLSVLVATAATGAAADQDQINFFETKIRPVLAEKCYGCHSVEAEGRKKLKGGLYLDSKDGVLNGGKDGVVLIPGDAEKSRLIHAIRYGNDDTAMPPKEKLRPK